jgi:hypothetical protein
VLTVRVLPDVIRLDRRAVRRRFEERFSAARMASDYISVYYRLRRAVRAPAVADDGQGLGANVVVLPRKSGARHHVS